MNQTPDSGESTEVEWAVRWDDEKGGIAWQGIGDQGHAAAVGVARFHGYGTPESRVSVVRRTVTYGPWTADADAD